MARVCIVTTVRDPGVCLESFICYHLAIGIDHIYVFFDDPEDPAVQIALKFSNVTAIPNDEALQVQQALWNVLYPTCEPHIGYEVMARQILNVETAIQLALEQEMDWILHIDGDELFYPGQMSASDYFDQLSSNISQVRFLNYEAAPEVFASAITFTRSRYLRRIPAARLHPDLLPNGVHGFDVPENYTLVTSFTLRFALLELRISELLQEIRPTGKLS
jgi:hypothetical protein